MTDEVKKAPGPAEIFFRIREIMVPDQTQSVEAPRDRYVPPGGTGQSPQQVVVRRYSRGRHRFLLNKPTHHGQVLLAGSMNGGRISIDTSLLMLEVEGLTRRSFQANRTIPRHLSIAASDETHVVLHTHVPVLRLDPHHLKYTDEEQRDIFFVLERTSSNEVVLLHENHPLTRHAYANNGQLPRAAPPPTTRVLSSLGMGLAPIARPAPAPGMVFIMPDEAPRPPAVTGPVVPEKPPTVMEPPPVITELVPEPATVPVPAPVLEPATVPAKPERGPEEATPPPRAPRPPKPVRPPKPPPPITVDTVAVSVIVPELVVTIRSRKTGDRFDLRNLTAEVTYLGTPLDSVNYHRKGRGGSGNVIERISFLIPFGPRKLRLAFMFDEALDGLRVRARDQERMARQIDEVILTEVTETQKLLEPYHEKYATMQGQLNQLKDGLEAAPFKDAKLLTLINERIDIARIRYDYAGQASDEYGDVWFAIANLIVDHREMLEGSGTPAQIEETQCHIVMGKTHAINQRAAFTRKISEFEGWLQETQQWITEQSARINRQIREAQNQTSAGNKPASSSPHPFPIHDAYQRVKAGPTTESTTRVTYKSRHKPLLTVEVRQYVMRDPRFALPQAESTEYWFTPKPGKKPIQLIHARDPVTGILYYRTWPRLDQKDANGQKSRYYALWGTTPGQPDRLSKIEERDIPEAVRDKFLLDALTLARFDGTATANNTLIFNSITSEDVVELRTSSSDQNKHVSSATLKQRDGTERPLTVIEIPGVKPITYLHDAKRNRYYVYPSLAHYCIALKEMPRGQVPDIVVWAIQQGVKLAPSTIARLDLASVTDERARFVSEAGGEVIYQAHNEPLERDWRLDLLPMGFSPDSSVTSLNKRSMTYLGNVIPVHRYPSTNQTFFIYTSMDPRYRFAFLEYAGAGPEEGYLLPIELSMIDQAILDEQPRSEYTLQGRTIDETQIVHKSFKDPASENRLDLAYQPRHDSPQDLGDFAIDAHHFLADGIREPLVAFTVFVPEMQMDTLFFGTLDKSKLFRLSWRLDGDVLQLFEGKNSLSPLVEHVWTDAITQYRANQQTEGRTGTSLTSEDHAPAAPNTAPLLRGALLEEPAPIPEKTGAPEIKASLAGQQPVSRGNSIGMGMSSNRALAPALKISDHGMDDGQPRQPHFTIVSQEPTPEIIESQSFMGELTNRGLHRPGSPLTRALPARTVARNPMLKIIR